MLIIEMNVEMTGMRRGRASSSCLVCAEQKKMAQHAAGGRIGLKGMGFTQRVRG